MPPWLGQMPGPPSMLPDVPPEPDVPPDPRMAPGEVEAMNTRVHTVLENCRAVMAVSSREPSRRRAQQLAQEMRDIEEVCSGMGHEWRDIQNAMNNMRSDLMQRDPRLPSGSVRAASADARVSSFSKKDMAKLRSPRRTPSSPHLLSAVSMSAGRLVELPPGLTSAFAKEAFRARLANLMHVYDHRDSLWDLDGVYKEMEHGQQRSSNSASTRAEHDRRLHPPPPISLPASTATRRQTTNALPAPPAEVLTNKMLMRQRMTTVY